MRIEVKVKPNARATRVEPREDGSLLVSVNAPPADGKANEAVLRAVAEHFDVPRSRVEIIRGASGRNKTLEIREPAPES
ncbi:MAG: DUF167 domain-containing protein [Bryobacterales bacterium]|nr:DUF167 domain-containing protein [Bryobacterales bacterium]